jgi:uncharacterized protein YgiM (DUF1202 family)
MRRSRFRPRLSVAVVVLAAVAVTGMTAAPSAARDRSRGRISVGEFMVGLGCWESGGRYDIRNRMSGAYGKYQIMPFNWPAWARQYLGRSSAPRTPANQDRVARGKLLDLRDWRGSWPRVALWWLTGSRENDRSDWSPYARRFVDGIMSLAMRAGTAAGRRTLPQACLSRPTRGDRPVRRPPARPSMPTAHRVVTAYILNVRTGPSLGHRVVGGLAAGTRFDPLRRAADGRGRTWFEVRRAGGGRGWVAGWWTRPAG